MTHLPRSPLELWVGPEATVSRVGNEYLDQSELSGFASRPEDVARLASLGASRVRFPVLWERVTKALGDEPNWTWSDGRLEVVKSSGLKPIAGLLHHGSGPTGTSLVDDAFPELLARYARQVAERYPWIDAWTPVNEPLTTARFAGLYGHWYPHGRDERTWWACLKNELMGTVLAMRAIRDVTPGALLVQTEDLGCTRATPKLQYQADFENVRRWLTFDLLSGRVDREHTMWKFLRWIGADERDLAWFQDNPLPPDILGINAYVTSERFLDHRLHLYPKEVHGGNERDAYADVEAVRVLGEGMGGFRARLLEAHERYGAPMAITEAHLGCTREEQLRWLHDAWHAAEDARLEGADVRAVTVWSAFGAFEWNSLLTRREGHYEPGLWDVRAEKPRPTALVTLARQLARGEEPSHPVLDAPGWWARSHRLLYPAFGAVTVERRRARPILVTGATGTLGRAFARVCEIRGLPYVLTRRDVLDIADAESVKSALDSVRPWAVVNAAGFVRVDDAESDSRNDRENVDGAAILAAQCALRGIPLVTYSSDLVFDGSKGRPYVESDAPNPLNAYGRSKRAAEEATLAAHDHALVVRTSAFFGPWDEYNFVVHVLRSLRERGEVVAAEDAVVSPTYVPDLVNASLDLLIDAEFGVWHLANEGALSWADFARVVAEQANLDSALVRGVATSELNLRAPRPAYTVLSSERGRIMPAFDSALHRFFRDTREETPTVLGAAD
ncbi:family 1 glycosylhydrolase [Deinococcus yavapaiensis]|uniref:dTDP-4-dehydrorhamnose reductase n=1 Tax=Deinococcus yavapaiensis KR-236 TaxID=694435 RepID=A0A318S9W5_9DEIO|nr:family 1 glycosylhydrolase [Deinococcus yavapaiensis]PYE53024.1 dTDP-4-dehydrorhamnose reductase [Deinococcus yavapaiensis KR-236]